MKIVLDAMGGDFAPKVNVDGAIDALREFEDIEVLLVGPQALLEQAQSHYVPIYRTQEETSAFTGRAIAYLSEAMAPRVTQHGVLVDVFGVGVLITGESGVGKSECALELIKRGHLLVADDVVDIARVGHKLRGESPEIVRDFMELRGCYASSPA